MKHSNPCLQTAVTRGTGHWAIRFLLVHAAALLVGQAAVRAQIFSLNTVGIVPERPPEEIISATFLGGTYYYLQDVEGSVIAITDASGQKVERYEYGNFGELLDPVTLDPIVRNPSVVGNRNFHRSRLLDDETGLYHRTGGSDYDPLVGRSIQRGGSLSSDTGEPGTWHFAGGGLTLSSDTGVPGVLANDADADDYGLISRARARSGAFSAPDTPLGSGASFTSRARARSGSADYTVWRDNLRDGESGVDWILMDEPFLGHRFMDDAGAAAVPLPAPVWGNEPGVRGTADQGSFFRSRNVRASGISPTPVWSMRIVGFDIWGNGFQVE